MHGITNHGTEGSRNHLLGVLRVWISVHRAWLALVVAPTLVVAAYYYLVASDLYESEAHFLVRSSDGGGAQAFGLGQLFGVGGSGASPSRDAASVADFLTSHDAVSAVQQRLKLIDIYRRPNADPWSRLWSADPTPERLLDYYRGKVDVDFDTDTGIASLRVRTFRPSDSYNLISTLLSLSESRVNTLNRRSYDSTLGVAQRQLNTAQIEVEKVQAQMTAFRKHDGVVNPQTSGQARVTMITTLQGNLAEARAELIAMNTQLSPASPQVIAASARVRALAAQVEAEQGRITTGVSNVATGMGTYESLQLRQDFAAKRYDAAAAGLEKARDQLTRQQLFVVRVVNPNMPGKALYPKRAKIVITTFCALLLAYAIGWLIAAGMKEHTA